MSKRIKKNARIARFPKKKDQKKNANNMLQTFSADELQSMEFPQLNYMVDGLITEGLTLLAGKPKMGKSWMALDLAMSVAVGSETFGQRQCQKGVALYCALEDNQRRLQRRMLKNYGEQNDWPPDFHFATQMDRLDNGGLEQLENWIIEYQPSIIIIDTFVRIRPTSRNDNSYEADYSALTPLQNLAGKYGIAIVLVHHLRKMSGDDPLDMVSGSTGFTGAVDTVLVLDRKSGLTTLYGRGRETEDIDIALELHDCMWQELGDSDDVRISSERKAVIQLLKTEEAAMGPKAIAEALNQPQDNIRQLLVSMATDGEVKKIERGKYVLP